MAKKFGKFLVAATAIGAAAVGAYYYLQGKDKAARPVEDEDDDFDDFSDDLDEDEGERGYVTLTPERVRKRRISRSLRRGRRKNLPTV